jgi:hypothetical protein
MGDACEMLIAAELTLAGIPALTLPDNWPHYDVIAQRQDDEMPLRISVKSRTYKTGADYVIYKSTDQFDWLAIVLIGCGIDKDRRYCYLVPRLIADEKARKNSPSAKTANERYWRIDEVHKLFEQFEENFSLKTS